MKKIYEFWKDNQWRISFDEGQDSRFGKPFDDEIARKEFYGFVEVENQTNRNDVRHTYELRIVCRTGRGF